MAYVIYKLDEQGDPCSRWYLTSLPNEENPLSGIGYQGDRNGVPEAAGTAPTEEDAKNLCEYLLTASYGPNTPHFYEEAPSC